jgi:ABC-type dipeptide/oligopeptide/nickel transport system permease subunit
MKIVRKVAVAILVTVFTAALLAGFLAPAPYAQQFREAPDARPSWHHPLGTDELGRDSLSRLLYGTRVSMLLAPAAALLATVIAAVLGGVAGYLGGWWERIALGMADLSLSLPWLFLLITVRAFLPLNVSPVVSVAITFALLGLLGWSAAGRVVCAGAKALRNAEFVLQAQALGCSRWRLLFLQVLPNLKPVLFAQFWISIPLFVLTEANLGILGLGVAEPLPSWGSLLRGLEDWTAVQANPVRLVPLLLLVIVVSCFQIVLPREDFPS